MTVLDYLRVFRTRWVIIAVAALVGLVGAAAVYLVTPPEYTANTSLYVSAQTGDNPQQAYQGAQLSEQRVKSYTELVTGRRIVEETIRREGLPDSPAELASRITATSALDSVIIDVSVTDESPEQAAAIANTAATVTTEVVEELERPTAPGAVAPVAVRVVQPAVAPESPSSTGLLTTLALGLLAGLAIGVAGALVRHTMDTSITSAAHATDAAGAPNLGRIAFDPAAPQTPLAVHTDPQSPRAEAFRQLRTNLQFVDVDNPRKVVVVTSSVAAEGKSTTVANTAIALGSTGLRVLAIEADLRKPKLSDLLGADRSVGLTRVLAGRMRLREAVQPWGGGAFDLLASGPLPPNPSELLGSRQMRALIDEARGLYDIVLIDTPPLLPVTDAAAVAPATDGAVIVCRYKKTDRNQLESAAQSLRSVGVEPLGTVLTFVPKGGPDSYGRYATEYTSDAAGDRPAPQAGRPGGEAWSRSASTGPRDADATIAATAVRQGERRPRGPVESRPEHRPNR